MKSPFIVNKLTFLQECVTQVEAQIQKRYQLQDYMHQSLDQKICDLQSKIYQLIGEPNQQNALEQDIGKLEQEKRQQELACWQDINALRKELQQLKKEYRTVMVSYQCLNQKN